ncbi:hypothetical protein C2845_PM01G23330 [Panicum miliaceum]|uniref:DUF6598 domain-containing protein n=1 Tax=Panicum miliaceum TaxID=4540 RepID=A0A3L6TF16_PANMI|nr:hypothetical protein C2845_PM01G23330 [Panicum miliaceum]
MGGRGTQDKAWAPSFPGGGGGGVFMADLVASLRSLVRNERLEAEAEGAARAERVGQMQQEIARKLLEAGDPDDMRAEDEDEEELEEEEALWERVRLLRIEKGEELEARYQEAENRILDYDPKQGGVYYTRIYLVHDFASFDHDEESPIPPMRFTDVVYKNKNGYELCEAVNILSVKIGSLDIEFPIHVYGTVIARDSLDKKLSTVDVMYGVVKDAVEATISIEVLAGEFFGEIIACTSSIKEKLVLHDRLAYITSGEKSAQIIPLLGSVVAVYMKEMLLLTIAAHTEDGEVTRCIDYTSKVAWRLDMQWEWDWKLMEIMGWVKA